MSQIAVTGASGMLGRALMRELKDYHPVGTGFSRARDGLVRLDLCDRRATDDFLSTHHPSIIIHTAAERRPDVSERDPEGTRALNVEATRHLSHRAKDVGAWVLYISTDYVFDGTHPPYTPGDATNPLNLYGETKLDGERALLNETSDAAVLRVGVLFGAVESIAESSVIAILKDVRKTEPVAIDDWGQRYPTYVDDVAIVCRQLVERRRSQGSMGGVWHWCGNERHTKYGQALIIGSILGLPTAHLRPDPNPPPGAPRPRDCQLDCSGLENIGIGQRTPFQQALEISLRQSAI